MFDPLLFFSTRRSEGGWNIPFGHIQHISPGCEVLIEGQQMAGIELRTKLGLIVRICTAADVVGSFRSSILYLLGNLSFPPKIDKSFAFHAYPLVPSRNGKECGWNVFDPLREYRRIGLLQSNSDFRIFQRNSEYDVPLLERERPFPCVIDIIFSFALHIPISSWYLQKSLMMN
jgi:hypothetical protein